MGHNKKYKVTSIAFGDESDPARILIEQYIKDNGRGSLSTFIRSLVIAALSKKGDKQLMIKMRKHRYKELGLKIARYGKERSQIRNKLLKQGIDVDEVL